MDLLIYLKFNLSRLYKNNNKKFYVLIFILILLSCDNTPRDVEQVLESAGDNRKELEAVIKHYKTNGNKQKLEAAYFLIRDLPNKYHSPYNNIQTEYINYLHKTLPHLSPNTNAYEMYKWSFEKNSDLEEWVNGNRNKWNSLKTESLNDKNFIRDIDIISKEWLIANIDEAFNTWQNVPWRDKINFEKFCSSILSYRSNSTIPVNDRKKLKSVFSKYKDSTIIESATLLTEAMKSNFRYNEALKEFSHMKVDDVFKTRNQICDHLNSAKLAALRSIGIPSNEVFSPEDTSWVRIEDENGNVYDYQNIFFTHKDKDGAIDKRRSRNYSKVYMRTYKMQPNKFKNIPKEDIPSFFHSRFIKDVSSDHISTANINIKIKYEAPKKTQRVYLCVFDKLKWLAIDVGILDTDNVNFESIGKEKIYFPAYYINHKFYPAADPIYLNDDGQITQLIANQNEQEKVELRRKYPWTLIEQNFAKLCKGMWFEGANNIEFNDPKRLITIKNIPNHHETLVINENNKYQYYRLFSLDTTQLVLPEMPTGIHLSELSFFNEKGSEIKGKPISVNREKQKFAANLFDDNIRTNFYTDGKGWVGIDAGKPVTLSKVKYLIQNSFNTIEVNDEYELFYWDNQWKSLGKRIAKEDFLQYDVPKNTVLWLRNLSKGKQEMIFFMKNGKQIWG